MPNKNYSNQSDFFEQVYQVVKLIPEGRVTSYGAIGAFLGAARSARVVGWAMNNAHSLSSPVPAHRVVNRNGLLTGKAHFSTPSRMQELLESEGIKIDTDKIVDFKHHFWDPVEELKL
ncbi:MAG TPA: cysteine methyltransferase [Bacteroidetes bacterium]|nr:cysteine methyltransferase [Bacteroidota bacterium]